MIKALVGQVIKSVPPLVRCKEKARSISELVSMVRIATHNGSFHADEVLACSMLKLLPQYKDAEIVRTRDPAIIEACDIVVDVGGVFDAANHRYDHHQKTFKDTFNSLDKSKKWVTKLSSAGLVYVHFGREIIATVLETDIKDPIVEKVLDKVYEGFVEEIDAIDNGISTHDGEPRYSISTNLSSRVKHLSPNWNDAKQDFDVGFYKSMEMVREEFLDKINYYGKAWWPARSMVAKALEERFTVDPSGQILEFANGGCPWKEHLFELEAEQGIGAESNGHGELQGKTKILFVIYTDQNGMWRVQCVPVRPASFENRLGLMEAWRGVRDADLEKVSGVEGATFVHMGGFIGGNKTREGALKMARLTIQAAP